MKYNINYGICAILFLAVIYIYLNVQYSQATRVNRLFRVTVLSSLILAVLDVVSAITISYDTLVPAWLNMLLNTLYYLFEASSKALLLYYVRAYLGEIAGYKMKSKLFWVLSDLPLLLFGMIMVMNIFTGYVFAQYELAQKISVFYIDADNAYQWGGLHLLAWFVSAYYLANMLLQVILYRKHLSRKYKSAMFGFLSVFILFTAMQIHWNFFVDLFHITGEKTPLTTCMGSAIGLFLVLLTLETPEYQRIVDTMEELNRAKESAMEANRAKSLFLATMSHEIRTPINGVLGMNTMILKQRDLTPSVRECALNIQSSGKGLLSIINDILDLSKIETGDLELLNEKYELHTLINDAYQMVVFRAKEKQLNLKVQIDPSVPLNLYGDATRVRQIVVNLLTNAVKYTHAGNVIWRINWEKLDEEHITLIVEVQDTGIGISQDDLKNLFKAFQRMDTKKNRNIEGTGLGLRITHQLVDLMNGKIEVESTYGMGSTFRVSIPQKVANWEAVGLYTPHAADIAEDLQVNFTAPEAFILAVDDVSMNLRVLKGLLKNTQIAIDTATSGVETLEKITKNHYDLIFLDHMMPGMNGVETLHYMRELPENLNADVPVIMLTANAIVGAREEYLKEGFTDYLSKPIQELLLRQMILEYLPKEKIRS